MESNNADENATAMTSTVRPGAAYLEWGAVFGGAIIAIAISVVLLQFGAGVGLAVGDPVLENGSPSWNVLVAGMWVILVALTSASAGGYIAGRMRSRRGDAIEAEVEFRDGTHGLAVWATSTVVVSLAAGAIALVSAIGTDPVPVATTDEILRIAGNISIIFTFATAAGAFLGAAAGWYSAVIGGQHRDQGLSVHEIVPRAFRRRVST